MVNLTNLWFLLIGILFTGFIFLEGFDFGVGILLPFVAKGDEQRQIAIGTIGPVWDGNEVWLLTAGGAMFAAFPYWYATMFSGFYLALFIVLASLIVRGVTFEFRNKSDSRFWRDNWDTALSLSSLINAILLPVAFANLIGGTPIEIANGKLEYVGGFWDLLTPFTLAAGLYGCLFIVFHGAVYLANKSSGVVETNSLKIGKKLGIFALIAYVLFIVTAYVSLKGTSLLSGIILISSGIILIISYLMFRSGKIKITLLLNFLVIALTMTALFTGLFPNAMISSLGSANNLTLIDAASSDYTLKVMSVIALTLLPFILAYQYWTFRVFKARMTLKDVNY
ncbi:cytochrome d ubiquinol oxidase subunit II [Fusibacter bizertensis]|uniref:Cytochrome d ubiquinol oxidase subunit II n=1 Tax=Fusibacter bizertensis TaxID=1488331 RepID=A0ABT6NBL4_9FIRM|nr:cytochrome d ubiquinol oxidase subunit II [Fusibacter bizertensis]MDH8677808.1 cytochrome d ubiquinol oxidase subunit II [Fusibacter bizertensis]